MSGVQPRTLAASAGVKSYHDNTVRTCGRHRGPAVHTVMNTDQPSPPPSESITGLGAAGETPSAIESRGPHDPDHFSEPDQEDSPRGCTGVTVATNDADAAEDADEVEVLHGSWVPVVAAMLLTWVGAIWIGVGRAGLATVSVTREGLTYSAQGSALSQTVTTGLTAAGLVLFTGYRRRAVGLVDGIALAGGAWVLGWVGLISKFSSGLEFGGPTYKDGPADTCVYASCWPAGYQGIAIAAPIIVAVLAAAAMATLGRRTAWWVRAAVPPVALVMLTLVQVAVWGSAVIPLFERHPPFG